MKRITSIFCAISLIALVGLLMSSCEQPCPSGSKTITRPDFTEDQMKWVKVSDTAPRFKVTTYDGVGNATIDTLQGHYTMSIENLSNLYQDECTTIKYQEATNTLTIKDKQGEDYIDMYFTISNYERDGGFTGSIRRNPGFNEATVLDTAYVNGKLYHDVYKYDISSPNDIFKIYYAKGVGFIQKAFSDQSIELIP